MSARSMYPGSRQSLRLREQLLRGARHTFYGASTGLCAALFAKFAAHEGPLQEAATLIAVGAPVGAVACTSLIALGERAGLPTRKAAAIGVLGMGALNIAGLATAEYLPALDGRTEDVTPLTITSMVTTMAIAHDVTKRPLVKG